MKRLSVFVVFLAVSLFAASAFAEEHNVIKFGSDVNITKDMVVDEVVVIGGNVSVSGRVNGNVIVVGGSVDVAPTAFIGREIVVVGGDLARDPASTIKGKVTQVHVPAFVPSVNTMLKSGWVTLWATVSTLVLIGFLGLAVLLMAFIPSNISNAVNALQDSFGMMLLWGVMWAVLIIPIAALLAISIIGILLIPLEILLVVLALVVGYIAAAIFIGKNVLDRFSKRAIPFVDAIVGIIILFVIGFVPVAGPIIKAVFLTAGFGAVITTRFGTSK